MNPPNPWSSPGVHHPDGVHHLDRVLALFFYRIATLFGHIFQPFLET